MKRFLPLFLAGCMALACAEEVPSGPVELQWREWGEKAFKEAKERERPIALFLVCSWAQSSMYLEQRSLREIDLVRALNARFIPIRVDRDRRPDIDVRYQDAVRTLSNASGWPLVAFLTPDGQVLLGGTFWRLDDDFLREQPGLATVVVHTAESWAGEHAELIDKAKAFEKELTAASSMPPATDVPVDVLANVAKSVRMTLAPPPGWDGARFPQPCAVELLIEDHARSGSKESLASAQTYLDEMLNGAICDRLNGGFHRFAMDRAWRRPRWEKLLPLNAEMLRVLIKAFQATGKVAYRDAAEGIVSWALGTLADRERGGFGSGQAAGCDPDDPGLYYTWTVGDVERVLDGEEERVFSLSYGIEEWGDWPEQAPHRNSLFVALKPSEVAAAAHVPIERIPERLASARRKLATASQRRQAPPVDPVVLVDANARMVSALLLSAEVLKRPEWRGFALKTLDRLIRDGVSSSRGTAHVLAPDNVAFTCLGADEAALAVACLDAFDATREQRYLEVAQKCAERLDGRFREKETGAYLDRSTAGSAPPALGRLEERRRPFADTPTPSLNAMVAEVHMRLAERTGVQAYAARASEVVRVFGGVLERVGVAAPSLVLMADRIVNRKP